MAGEHAEAAAAYGRALALTVEPRLRDWIAARRLAQLAAAPRDLPAISASRPAGS